MNAIQLLQEEHEKAKDMFAQIQEASEAARGPLWRKLEPALKVHEQMEETALYGPVAEAAGSKDAALQEWETHHHEDVGELESMIQELGALDPATDQWLEKIQELQDTLEDHIEEEEEKIWPRIQRAWDQSKLDQAGKEMEAMKKKLMQAV